MVSETGHGYSLMRRRNVAICMPNSKATDIHWQYLILIALPREQWLCERASILRYTNIARLVPTFRLFLLSAFKADTCSANHSRLDRMKCRTWLPATLVLVTGTSFVRLQKDDIA
jgi:hypothetical protein